MTRYSILQCVRHIPQCHLDRFDSTTLAINLSPCHHWSNVKKKHFWSIQWFIIIFPIEMTINWEGLKIIILEKPRETDVDFKGFPNRQTQSGEAAVPSIPSCPVASGCPVWLKAQHRVHGLRRKVRQAVVEATKEELSEVTIGMDWWDNLQENIGRLCFSLWHILKYRVFLSIFP